MLKIIFVLLIISLNAGSTNNQMTGTDESNLPINALLSQLFTEYGYTKAIPQNEKEKLRLDLQYRIRSLVKNDHSYHSYALFLLGQLNEGEDNNILNEILIDNDWQKQMDSLKTISFFGNSNDLSLTVLESIKNNHWFGGIKILSKKVAHSLEKEKLSFDKKRNKWEEYLDKYYGYIEKCKLDNRDIAKDSLQIKVNQIDDSKLKNILISNEIPIDRLLNIKLGLNGFKLIATLSNKLIIINSNYELTVLNTFELKAKKIFQQNNKIFILLNGYDVSGHDQLYLLNTKNQSYDLKYMFTFLYYVEGIKKNDNLLEFNGSNWSMNLNTQKLIMSEINVCDTSADLTIGL
ncbi:MAG: hypothetical protein ACK5L8_12565 [Marinicella pacifica]